MNNLVYRDRMIWVVFTGRVNQCYRIRKYKFSFCKEGRQEEAVVEQGGGESQGWQGGSLAGEGSRPEHYKQRQVLEGGRE